MIQRLHILLVLLGIILSSSLYVQAQSPAFMDSLRNGAETEQGVDRIPYLDELAWQLMFSKPNKALDFAEEAMRLAEESKDSSKVAFSSNTLAACFIKVGEYEKALKANHRALRIRRANGKPRDIGSSLSKIGLIYQEQTRLDSAIPYQIEALKYLEEAGDSGAVAQTYLNLSSIFKSNKNYDKALDYAKKSRDLCREIGFSYGLAGSLGNISMLLGSMDQYEEAKKSGEEALVIFRQINSKGDIATQLNNLGSIERKLLNHLKGLERYKEAYEIAKSSDDKYGIAKYRANIAATHVSLKNYKLAEKLYLESLEEASSAKLYSVVWQCEEGLANSLEKQGRYKEALYHFQRFKAIKDSLFTVEKDRIIQELEVRYQTDKKEQENIFLAQQNEIIQLESSRNKAFFWSSLGIFLLLAIAGILFYSRQKVRQENRLQVELLQERERGLVAMVEATEEERKRIAKDLHDGVGQQLSGLKLAWQKLLQELKGSSSEHQERLSKLSDILDDATADLRSLSHQMMPKALSELGLVPAIEDMLEKSLGPTNIDYQFDHHKMNVRFDENMELCLYRVCQELVNNVIKHSEANEVHIQLLRTKSGILLIVEDAGKGISKTTKADGIGLTNIRSRLDLVDGEFNLEPGPESGTIATVRVNLT